MRDSDREFREAADALRALLEESEAKDASPEAAEARRRHQETMTLVRDIDQQLKEQARQRAIKLLGTRTDGTTPSA